MSCARRSICLATGIITVWSAFAPAQNPIHNPTFSLEATEINGVPLAGGPSMRLSAAPGDTILFKLFLRDWSPDGEKLRAYQAQVDRDGYTSGLAGQIKPLDYEATTGKQDENRENCFVDVDEPTYVLGTKDNFAIADTRSPGYRWLGILLHGDVVAKQDGKKYYCGSLRVKVSEDAVGSFRVALVPGQGTTTLRDPLGAAILPVDIEDSIVEVAADSVRVIASDPPNNAIDARAPRSASGGAWDQVALTFNRATASLTAADFTVEDESANPPKIVKVESMGTVVTVVLDRPIAPGRWTTILHRKSQTGTRIGCLRGDVNNDGRVGIDDLFDLVYGYGDDAPPVYRTDVNQDNRNSLADALRVLDMLTMPGAHHVLHLEP